MADAWIAQYKELRASWVAARGAVGQSKATGAQLPRMIAGDALILIATFTAPILRFHELRAQRSNGVVIWEPYAAVSGYTVDLDITIEGYLKNGVAKDGEARLRKMSIKEPVSGMRTDVYVRPVMPPSLVEAQKQTMASWQAAVDAASAMLKVPPVTRALTKNDVEALWSNIYRLCVALDVTGEIPVKSDWEHATDALKHAGENLQTGLEVAADVAGRAAAEVAETAGRVAGGAAHGFFAQAGLTALIVTAGAVYIALR